MGQLWSSSKLYECDARINAFKKMFAEDRVDINFVIHQNGEIVDKFPAHKALLSAVSPVFEVMFNGNWKEQSEVIIVDASPSSFKEFLTFFYRDKIPLTEDNIFEVLNLTVKYQVQEGSMTCLRFLLEHLSTSNVIRTYEAVKLAFDENLEFSKFSDELNEIGIFVIDNTISVLRSQDFLCCTNKTLESILQLNTFTCDETEVFDACMEWARNACESKDIDSSNAENLRNELGDCFKLIRYNEMDEKAFAERYRLYSAMFSKEELSDIFLKFNFNENEGKVKYRKRETKPTLIEVDEPLYRCTFRKVDKNHLCFNIQFRVTGSLLLQAIKFFKIWDHGTDYTVSIKVMTILTIWCVSHSTNDSKLLFTAVMEMNSNDDELTFQTSPLSMEREYEYTIQLSCQPPIHCLNRDIKIDDKMENEKGVSLVEVRGKTIFPLLPQDNLNSELQFQHFK